MAQNFWGCAYAKMESAFNRVLAEVQELNEEVTEHISKFP